MPRIEPHLLPAVTDLSRGLRELDIPFGIVGALVPELLLDVRPVQLTNDVDATVVVQSLEDFDTLKDRLSGFGFARTRVPLRMQHASGGLVDLLPFSDAIAPDGRLQLEPDFVLNMAGFGRVVSHAVPTPIDGGPTLPVAPLALYVLLKLVAFSDRQKSKDLTSVFHCLQHYLENDERRYDAEHAGEGVPYEYTCAYLLGADGRRFLDIALRETAARVLDRFGDPDADAIGVIARDQGRMLIEDEERVRIFENFHWYRLGAEL